MINRLKELANALAKRQVAYKADCNFASSARIDFRGLRDRPPSQLSIGERSIFNGRIASDRKGSAVVIGRDTFIGDSLLICAQRIEVGNDVLISWGCTIVDHHSHAVTWAERSHDVADWYGGCKDWRHVRIAPIKIQDRAWVGFNSIILAGVTIGEGAVVGCASVVTRDVDPYTIVAGNPARVIRSLKNADR
jgi:acetyltransferase-like isoleucine patch superfamily enzyme